MPLEQTLRPMTLPRRGLRGDVGFRVDAAAASAVDTRTVAALGLGAGLGITDDVELSVSVLPLELMPDVAYLNPYVAGTFRFFHDRTFQVGLNAAVFVPAQSPFAASVSGLLWVALDRMFQLRTSVTYRADIATEGVLAYAHTASAAVDLVFQPIGPLYMLLGTGVAVPLPGSAWVTVAQRIAIPVRAEVGVTIPSARSTPIADLFVSFAFPELFVPGANGDVVLTAPWSLLVGARLFFTV